VVDRLRQLAKLHHRSLQGELLAIVETAVLDDGQPMAPAETLARAQSDAQSRILRRSTPTLLPIIRGLPHALSSGFKNSVLLNLSPLAGLSNLQVFDCSNTQVSDLTPVTGLANLQTFTASQRRRAISRQSRACQICNRFTARRRR
jgi:Leucine-rich repeat (LRR) protein